MRLENHAATLSVDGPLALPRIVTLTPPWPYSLIFTAHICTLKLGEVLRQVEGKDLPLDTEEIPVKALNTRHAE